MIELKIQLPAGQNDPPILLIISAPAPLLNMKLSTALLALPALAAADSLRASGPNFKDVYQSACNSALDETSCYATTDDESGQACEWCVAGAVPSECLSPDQANMVPAGVFECKTPSADAEVPSFQFEGMFYELNEKEGDDDFCDPASKSLSGYLDVKGSKYDENGENKHLFYWMFEKRGAADLSAEEKGEIPFVVWLTGGPGCSSTLALLVGRLKINPLCFYSILCPYADFVFLPYVCRA